MLLLVCNPVNFVYYMDAEEINHMESLFKKKKKNMADRLNELCGCIKQLCFNSYSY